MYFHFYIKYSKLYFYFNHIKPIRTSSYVTTRAVRSKSVLKMLELQSNPYVRINQGVD